MISLGNLHKATEQEVFNQAARHMLEQNEKSISSGGWCQYRGISGRSCPGGCLMTDEEYSSEMEGKNWQALVKNGYAPNVNKRLICWLQSIHDSREPENWRESLIALAYNFDLNTNVLE